MAKKYPALDIRLVGEPRQVRDLVKKIDGNVGQVEDATSPLPTIILDGLDGPTRQRAWGKAQTMLERASGITAALNSSAGVLRKWAGDIEKYRKEFDDLEKQLVEAEQERADVSIRLYALHRVISKGDADLAQAKEYDSLVSQQSALDWTIGRIAHKAEGKLKEYEDKAKEVGNSLVTASFDSPAVSHGQRQARDALGFSQGLGKLLDIVGLAGFVGALGPKLLAKGGKKVLDKINDSIQKTLIAGAGAKYATDVYALANGANISPLEVFFDGANLKGIGPLDKLKGEALDKIKDDVARALVGKAIGEIQRDVKGEVFGERKPPDPSRPSRDWQGDPPDGSNYA